MTTVENVKIFISHTKKDKKFCDEFDIIVARVGIPAFRSEYEDIKPPAWKTIRNAINNSVAVFFLVGKELVESQESEDSGWRYTQNWMAYEIGAACQKGIDVWAICDEVKINFPMPYVNNYFISGLKRKPETDYIRIVLERYRERESFSVEISNEELGVKCPYDNCRMEFNLHSPTNLKSKSQIKCPQCLKDIVFPGGFPSKTPCVIKQEWYDRDIL